MDIHYLRFPEAIKPHGCWTAKQWFLPPLLPVEQPHACACVCLYFNRPSPVRPTGVHNRPALMLPCSVAWFSITAATLKKDRQAEEREREATNSTTCARLSRKLYQTYKCTHTHTHVAHIVQRDMYTLHLLHVGHTCSSSLSFSACSMKVKSSFCADFWAHRRFSSSRSAIIYQTVKQVDHLTWRRGSCCRISVHSFENIHNPAYCPRVSRRGTLAGCLGGCNIVQTRKSETKRSSRTHWMFTTALLTRLCLLSAADSCPIILSCILLQWAMTSLRTASGLGPTARPCRLVRVWVSVFWRSEGSLSRCRARKGSLRSYSP